MGEPVAQKAWLLGAGTSPAAFLGGVVSIRADAGGRLSGAEAVDVQLA
jgi:hypothetical protein